MKLFKDERGSVTIMAYVAMLFISLYGAILLGNATRKYKIQSDEINSIKASYMTNIDGNELQALYYSVGGEAIKIDT